MKYEPIIKCKYGPLSNKISCKPDFFSGFVPQKRKEIVREEANFYRELTRPYYEKLKIKTKDYFFESYDGYEIKVRTYESDHLAKRKKDRRLVVFLHGGGFITCSIDTHNFVPAYISDHVDCLCLSVEYRLAPEFKYPTGLKDSYEAIMWAISNKKELGFDEQKIIVMGDSSGGNFATVLSLIAKEKNEFTIRKQILIYPVTDFVEVCSKKSKEIYQPVGSNDENALDIVSLYLKDPTEEIKSKYVSPILTENFKNMPESLFIQAECDAYLDDGLIYANLLLQAGNKVNVKIYEGMPHAFILRTHKETFAALDEICRFIQKQD